MEILSIKEKFPFHINASSLSTHSYIHTLIHFLNKTFTVNIHLSLLIEDTSSLGMDALIIIVQFA